MEKIFKHKLEVKTWIAILSFILILLGMFASVVAMKTTLENGVESNSDRIEEHEDLTQTMSESIQNHEKRLVTIETHYDHIEKSLDKIETKLEDIS